MKVLKILAVVLVSVPLLVLAAIFHLPEMLSHMLSHFSGSILCWNMGKHDYISLHSNATCMRCNKLISEQEIKDRQEWFLKFADSIKNMEKELTQLGDKLAIEDLTKGKEN